MRDLRCDERNLKTFGALQSNDVRIKCPQEVSAGPWAYKGCAKAHSLCCDMVPLRIRGPWLTYSHSGHSRGRGKPGSCCTFTAGTSLLCRRTSEVHPRGNITSSEDKSPSNHDRITVSSRLHRLQVLHNVTKWIFEPPLHLDFVRYRLKTRSTSFRFGKLRGLDRRRPRSIE